MTFAAALTDSDPNQSDTPYALVAVALVSFAGFWLVLVIATCVVVRSRFNRILYMGLKTTGGEGLGPVDPFPPPPPPLPPSVPRPSPPVRAAPDLDATQTGAEIIRASGSSPGGGVDMPPVAEIIVEEPAPPGGAAGGDEEI